MGRLIDVDVLREEVYSWGMNDYEPSDFTDAIDDVPTVEAIPKDQYEARLKADMVDMLTEILTDFDNQIEPNSTRIDCESIIEQKINSLKENKDEEN